MAIMNENPLMDKYSRQQLFVPIGLEGQKKIRQKHVLIVGAGALGSGNAEMLVRAGVGKLTIIDRDYVEFSNLQRQQLYTEQDAMQSLPKAIAAKKRLEEINSDVEIFAYVMDASPLLLEPLLENVDVIVDATDNFDTRMLINDLSQKYSIPWVYGACVGSYGMTYTITENAPCMHCLLTVLPMNGMTCDTAGVIAPSVAIVVAYQTTEVLKLLIEDSEVRKTFITFDVWTGQHTAIKVSKMKKTTCPSCGEQPTYPFLSSQPNVAVLCGRNTVQVRFPKQKEVELTQIRSQLKKAGIVVEGNAYLLKIILDEHRVILFQDGRILVHGTNDVAFARKLCQKYFG